MYVLITGDRNWTNPSVIIFDVLWDLYETYGNTLSIVHGYADGVDLQSHICAEAIGLTIYPCPAHWNHNTPRWISVYGHCTATCQEKCGFRAGPIRNRYMIKKYPIDLTIGFHENIKKSKGTKDMLIVSQKNDIETWLH